MGMDILTGGMCKRRIGADYTTHIAQKSFDTN